jgi:hypothetical protein
MSISRGREKEENVARHTCTFTYRDICLLFSLLSLSPCLITYGYRHTRARAHTHSHIHIAVYSTAYLLLDRDSKTTTILLSTLSSVQKKETAMTTVLLRSKKPGVRSSQTNSNNKYARYSVLEEPRSSRNRYGKYMAGNVSKTHRAPSLIACFHNIADKCVR